MNNNAQNLMTVLRAGAVKANTIGGGVLVGAFMPSATQNNKGYFSMNMKP
ncbi:MAG: hypothetical protein AAB870_05160 [Patescibacteria group bacterium]